ncbi:MAG: carbohydrate deacetylase [Pseudorhodoplanes sp.]|uniref:carbohydrate deacetylase n=1 Tax=Pseudorhodoplanes sp. TaxID=1934341 RepID=UPI003D0DF311
MNIVTSADDFGYDEDTTERTIACFEDGILTGASIMANMPATERAADYARARPELCFGAHLVFCTDTVEKPLCDPRLIPAITAPGGSFLPSNRVRLLGLMGRIPPAQVAAEATAQLSRLSDLGVKVRYVDSHGHLHKIPCFQRALAEILPRFNIRAVRLAQNVFLETAGFRPMSYLYPMFNGGLRRRFATTAHFYMPETDGATNWPRALLQRLPQLNGTIEVGVHPGRATGWRASEERDIRRFVAAARAAGHRVLPLLH